MVSSFVKFVREQYETNDFVPLHAPIFSGKENEYVVDTLTSTFVSSVGEFVDRFENDMAAYVKSPRAVATVNGTAALHTALLLAGVKSGDLVITQALTFVATCNAIRYCGAEPVFVDVDRSTLGLSPTALEDWLTEFARLDCDGVCRLNDKDTHAVIRACVPMHTFGHPANITQLLDVCRRWNLVLVEDAAESLGSFYKGQHTGTFGKLGVLSFNGNKIITTGGGGMILSNDEIGVQAKHITTTAKRPHAYEYVHDTVGFNYRLPNLNAALGCAQLERLEEFIAAKRILASRYASLFKVGDLQFVFEPDECRSNYWLNAVICDGRAHRDEILKFTNGAGVMTRPVWEPMSDLNLYSQCLKGDLSNTSWLAARIINIPSGVPKGYLT